MQLDWSQDEILQLEYHRSEEDKMPKTPTQQLEIQEPEIKPLQHLPETPDLGDGERGEEITVTTSYLLDLTISGSDHVPGQLSRRTDSPLKYKAG